MNENSNRQRVRVSLDLNEKQEAGLMDYLTRSTCFWNFLIDHLKPEINEYVLRGGDLKTNGESTLLLKKKAEQYTDYVLYGQSDRFDIPSKIAIKPHWNDLIDIMRRLPSISIRDRLNNLLEAFENYVKAAPGSDGRKPRAKTERSAEAVLLPISSFTFKGDELTIKGISGLPVVIKNPAFERLNKPIDSIIIGKRGERTPDQIAKYGPMQEKFFLLI